MPAPAVAAFLTPLRAGDPCLTEAMLHSVTFSPCPREARAATSIRRGFGARVTCSSPRVRRLRVAVPISRGRVSPTGGPLYKLEPRRVQAISTQALRAHRARRRVCLSAKPRSSPPPTAASTPCATSTATVSCIPLSAPASSPIKLANSRRQSARRHALRRLMKDAKSARPSPPPGASASARKRFGPAHRHVRPH